MKAKKVFLNELTSSSQNYKVRVRVIEKNRPQLGQVRKLPYQGLLLVDDKGNKMRAALFGDQIRTFKDALVYNGTYDIANAPIKPMDDKWKKSGDELNYQMGFGRGAVIQAVETGAEPVQPDFNAIGHIPRVGDPADKFDVLGIVLFVDEKPRQANVKPKRTNGVTEVVLMDHSTPQPLSISAWGDLADTASETLFSKTNEFSVIAFTALKVSNHKGFSMTTTMSSEIIQEPTGPKVIALQNWSANNLQKLTELRTRLVQAKVRASQRVVITIAALHEKRAQHTLQDERFWLHVTVPSAEFENLNAYLGCSKCGRRSDMPAEATYSCPLCNKEGCVSTPRVTFSCEVTDGTGNLTVTAFTNHSEQMFQISAQDLFRVKHSEDLQAFEAAQVLMRETPFLIEVGPKNTLSISNILEWGLKQVVVEANESGYSAGKAETNNHKDKESVVPTAPDLIAPEHLKTPNKVEVRNKQKNPSPSTLLENTVAGVKVIDALPVGASCDTPAEHKGEPVPAVMNIQGRGDTSSGYSGDIARESS